MIIIYDFTNQIFIYIGDNMDNVANSVKSNGAPFTTKDRDNINCADNGKGGWWYASCTYAALNDCIGYTCIWEMRWGKYLDPLQKSMMMLSKY